jgi:hypothetical protein
MVRSPLVDAAVIVDAYLKSPKTPIEKRMGGHDDHAVQPQRATEGKKSQSDQSNGPQYIVMRVYAPSARNPRRAR